MTFGGWRNTCEPPGQHGHGNKGDQGDTGICVPCVDGAQGDTGIGIQGDTGIGSQGDTGVGTQGDTGVGVQGDTGIGTQGDTGVGIQGDTGAAGSGTGSSEDLDNVIMFIQSDHGLFYEDANWDVRLRTSAAVAGDNILLVQGWRSDTTNLEVWT